MAKTLTPNPAVLHLDRIIPEGDQITLLASAKQATVACPGCGTVTSRIHRHYQRTVADLPWQGMAVRFRLRVRKFFCDNRECQRRIFTEPLPQVVNRHARKTTRLTDALTELVYLVGGEAAARIARAFGLLVSPDTLLRHLKRLPIASAPTPRVLGVDDFAFRKGQRYGTILVDLEQRCPIDLLPDREPETLIKWLQDHPGIEVISRDRGIAYIEGATKGAPNALQVADRWHLLKNLGDALERWLTRNHSAVRAAATVPAPPPPELANPPPREACSYHKRDKQARRERRLARYNEVEELQAEGLSQREISRRTGLSRNTVSKMVKNAAFVEIQPRPPRQSKLAPFMAYVKRRWQDGCYNAIRLFEEIVGQGFTGSINLVQRYVESWRDKPRSRVNGRHPPPVCLTPRQVAFLLTNPEHPRITEEQRAFMGRLSERCPQITDIQALAMEFCRLIRERDRTGFASWLAAVNSCGVAELQSFVGGLLQDRAAVEAALSSEWSNGQVEGQVNRLKFLTRSMYGRASFDLLKARVLPRKVA